MDRADFEPYIGELIQVGIPNYSNTQKLFMHSGFLKKVTDDGIFIQSKKREIFLRYNLIQYYSPFGGRFARY